MDLLIVFRVMSIKLCYPKNSLIKEVGKIHSSNTKKKLKRFAPSALRASVAPLLKSARFIFPSGETFTGHRFIEKLVQVEIFPMRLAKVKQAQRISSSIKEAVK